MFKHRKYQNFTDEELVSKIQQDNDIYCLGILYERYGHLVYGLALKYLTNKNDAEDVTSHLFESLVKKIQTNAIQQFKSWLYTVSKNECLMFIRRSKKMNYSNLDLTTIEETSDDIDIKEIQFELLEQKIKTLKPDQQNCIRLFYLEEKSYKEISVELNCSINQVKSSIQNGKRNLKILLDQHHEFNQ